MNVMKDLEKYGITIDNIVDSGMALCISEDSEIEDIKNKLKKTLLEMFDNPNVSTLLICAILLDEEGMKGKLPFDYDSDPTYVYADEVIGMAIANEISGTKAVFNFKWYDAKKPGIIGILDKKGYMFLDDAIAGLVAGCMSKIFE
jgi:alpha-ribazole phosphatase CobZ